MNDVEKETIIRILDKSTLTEKQKEFIVLVAETSYYMGKKDGIENTAKIWMGEKNTI